MVNDRSLRNARPHKAPFSKPNDSPYDSPQSRVSKLNCSTGSPVTVIPESPIDVIGDKLFDAECPTPKTPSNKGTPSTSAKSTPSHNKSTPTQNKKKCPCKKSDKNSTYITCNKCQQQWHNRCSNLLGLSPSDIKKMELWECPSCYICPALSRAPASLYADIRSTKEVVTALCLSERSSKQGLVNDDVAEKLDMLQQEVKGLRESAFQRVDQPHPESTTLLTAENFTSIQNSLLHLTEQVTSMKSSLGNRSSSSPRPPTNSMSQPNRGPGPTPPPPPNTVSPHSKKHVTPCKPYEMYDPLALSQELKEEVQEFISGNCSEYTSVGENSREVMYFGDFSYRYTGTEHPAREMPNVLKKLLDTIAPKIPPPVNDRNTKINSCLISRYSSGANHIPMHRDDEPVIDPESHILTISLGATRTMSFCNNDGSQSEDLPLQDSSLLVTTRYAQDFWKHGILPDENVSSERVSLTFRHISPHFINSTIILGDSNTSRMTFGESAGTFGRWVPGKRVLVGHVEALPDATEIGPYRNIVIHTGINSINSRSHPRSEAYLLHVLESKCRDIRETYPKAKIHLSMLLPTRLNSLNRKVESFNQGILDLSYQQRNIFIIDNSIFGRQLTDEHGRWDIAANRPLTSDIVHLGKSGIRKFAANIKESVAGRRSSQSKARFNTSRGNFSGAVSSGVRPP